MVGEGDCRINVWQNPPLKAEVIYRNLKGGIMNPVFVLLVILGGIILWFSVNSLFPLIGKIVCGLFEETKFNITKEDEE